MKLVYENYKEPLRQVKGGYGYMGTIAQSEDGTLVQCHECGGMFPKLFPHIWREHSIRAREYKEKYGLALGTALMSDTTREAFVAGHRKNKKTLPVWLDQYNKDVQSGKRKHKGGMGKSLEWHNKNGTCPDQILDKIQTLAKKLGRVPGLDDFRAEYKYRYVYSLELHFGTWSKAVKRAGFEKTAEDLRTYTKPEMLELMKNFHKKYGRTPGTSDFKRGLMPIARGTYNYHFGSLNNARVAAGFPALVPLTNGMTYEIEPERYEEYVVRRTAITNPKEAARLIREIAGEPVFMGGSHESKR